ncbi:hypothetical protein [Alkalibaculum bacchi]|uniref:hypothetical protein n=1 Tax=Alkalibaculum bacchi TaxID=645887 RepID=UPI0026F19CD4|nr:hypothetical protein [Alkalibaculum bacchi]
MNDKIRRIFVIQVVSFKVVRWSAKSLATIGGFVRANTVRPYGLENQMLSQDRDASENLDCGSIYFISPKGEYAFADHLTT